MRTSNASASMSMRLQFLELRDFRCFDLAILGCLDSASILSVLVLSAGARRFA